MAEECEVCPSLLGLNDQVSALERRFEAELGGAEYRLRAGEERLAELTLGTRAAD